MSTVTIYGTGNMARGIATRLLAGGTDVEILSRSEEAASKLAADLGSGVRAGTVDATPSGDVVILALWYDAAREVLSAHGSKLSGKTIVDISNPVDTATFDGLVTPPDSSAAEQLAELVADASVVKAFNTTFAGTLVAGEVGGQPLDVLVASDSDEAKQTVSELITSAGLRAIDAGPLRRARELEALGFLHMTLQGQFRGAYDTTVKFLG